MSDQPALTTHSLAGVAHRCTLETALFFQHRPHDPRFCYELFRRAIIERDQRAWDLIYAQYQALVAGWVERHPAFTSSGEETQYFVNRAFEKMWMALPAERFRSFLDLKSLLRYLQMCVHSAILDCVRAAEQADLNADVEALADASGSNTVAVEDEALGHVQKRELWQEINALLHTDKERRLIYGSFVLALKPQELCARYPRTFKDADEVYAVKQNVLARLRRSGDLRRFLNPDA